MKKIPHLFGKTMVIWCVLAGTIFSSVALFVLYKTGYDASATLAIVLAFFGGELALMFGRNALQGKNDKNNKE